MNHLRIDRNGWNKLHHAVKNGDLQEVERLLAVGLIDVNAGTGDGLFAPLHVAAKFGRFQIARRLVEHGALIDAQDRNGLVIVL